MTLYSFAVHNNFGDKPELMISIYDADNRNLETLEDNVIRVLSKNGFDFLWRDDKWKPNAITSEFKSTTGVIEFTIYPNNEYSQLPAYLSAEGQSGVIESVAAVLAKDKSFHRDDIKMTLNTFEVRDSFGPNPEPLIEFHKVWEYKIVEKFTSILTREGFEFLEKKDLYVEEYSYATDTDWTFKSSSNLITLSKDIWGLYFIIANNQPDVIEGIAKILDNDPCFQELPNSHR